MTELNQTRVQQTCTEICRICGSKENLKHVFQEGTDELLDKIRICANIHIDALDSLPKFVCRDCEEGLEFSYRLRKRGEETEKMLRQELLDSVKIQPCSSDEENETDAAGDVLVEESREELYVKQEDIAPFDEDLIEHVEDEISPKKFCDETEPEQWITQPNETLSEIDEIMDNFGVGHIKEEPIMNEKGNCNLMIEELDQTDSQKETIRKARTIQIECENCAEVFPTKCKYFEHVKEHGNERFHCFFCDKWFSRKYIFNQHMKNHSGETSAFPCDICEKSYTNYWNLARHTRTAHNGERKFQCAECNDSFSRADVLKMHMAKHSDERNVECNFCNKKFKTNQNLFFHKKCHLDKSERPKKSVRTKPTVIEVYLCDVCKKISHHRTTHLNHLRTHTGEKPFECSCCDKSFRTSSARRNHMLTHTDQRPYKCKICDLSFRQNCHLKSHMLIHDGVKRYVCDFCQKPFTMKSNLMVHLRTHTGEMPYECNMCPQKFAHLNQVKRHKLSHINEDGEQNSTCNEIANEMETDFNDSQISLFEDDIIEITSCKYDSDPGGVDISNCIKEHF